MEVEYLDDKRKIELVQEDDKLLPSLLGKVPISWYSKWQNTVESFTFGSEFIALRIAVEKCQSLRYKLRMFGVPIEGPSLVFCDNQSVTNNVSVPTSLLS